MRIVIDAIGVRPGSAAIVTAGVIRGWREAAPNDDVIVLADGRPDFAVPPGVRLISVVRRERGPIGRLWAQTVGVRRVCAAHQADAVLSALPAGALLGARRRRGVIVYDLRHELRPWQFSRGRRALRHVLWGRSFRRADALLCISERTRGDLSRRHPRLSAKAHVALLGVDHVAGWSPPAPAGPPYVLAFGHFAHKNIATVLQAWQTYVATTEAITLRVVGLDGPARDQAAALVAQLGVSSRVELLDWLDDAAFEAVFAGAGAIVFPSDFEGFGLPAVEALRLGVPVVISADPALQEVTAGHAVTATDDTPDVLAAAIGQALATPAEAIAAGVRHASAFTWERCARQMREALSAPQAV